MATRHGKDTVITIDGEDISEFTDNTDFNDSTEMHERTGYGAARKRYNSGLGDGKITISGTYDDSMTGPAAVLLPLKAAGAPVPFVYQVAGAGAGKPQRQVDVLVAAFNTSSPVAGNVKWTADLQMDGDLDDTPQV